MSLSPRSGTTMRAMAVIGPGKVSCAPAGAYSLSRVGIDASTTARIGACRPMGFSPASVPEGFQRGTKGSGYPVDTTAEGG